MSTPVFLFKNGALYPRGVHKTSRPINSAISNPAVQLVYSSSLDRTNFQPLNDSQYLAGNLAIFSTPDTNVKSVTYKFAGIADRTDTVPPFDFKGNDANGQAVLWDTRTVNNGSYSITAQIIFIDNTTATSIATFGIVNDSPLLHVAGSPTNLVATAGTNQAILSWAAPVDTGNPPFTGYHITSTLGHNIQVNDALAQNYTVSGLSAVAVKFSITTVNSQGESTIANFNAVTPENVAVQVTQPASSTYPNASVTGWQPTGVTLSAPTSGTMTISGTDTTLDMIDHTGVINFTGSGTLTIKRSRLVNTNSWVLRRYSGYVVIEDCELDGNNKGTGGAIVYNNYTLRRCNIHNFGEGPRISGGNVLIEDCWIHGMVQVSTNHTDAMQSVGGSNVRIHRNRVDLYNSVNGLIGNAGFQFGEESSIVRDTIVEDNYFNGGNYTINGRGGGTTGAIATFRRNKYGHNVRYGIKSVPSGCVWETATNIYEDTGQPV